MTFPAVNKNVIELFPLDHNGGPISIDFEFDPKDPIRPTVVGLSDGNLVHSAKYDNVAEWVLGDLERREPTWVGHNALTVEKPMLERIVGHLTPVERVEDTMVMHYLCNAELTKGVGKGGDEDEEEKGAGYMDLWSMASLYTDLPNWKNCRGDRCEGPCPEHDELGYNGMDTFACAVALPRLVEDMNRKEIPNQLYHNLKKLTLLCQAMTDKGIKVDRVYVATLEKEFEEQKQKIFPSRTQMKTGKGGQQLTTEEIVWEAPFNPRSPAQIIKWFNEYGVRLLSTEKEDIQAALKRGHKDPRVVEWLTKLSEYKETGKGLKAWMDERYFDAFDTLHPRFIVTGTCTGRLASSNPNFQNMPRVGWGKQLRRSIVARPGQMIVKADKSQLELRVVLWYAGVPVDTISGDAFTWLVEAGGGVFEEAERITKKGWTPRDHAKSVSHGGDYLEGVKILHVKDLDDSRTKRLIEQGALVVYRDWSVFGGLVGFTGVNLAERLFGSASWEHRAKALAIQEAYFSRFPAIRRWQRKVSYEAERGYVRSASGRYLKLLGTPEDKMKIAVAFYGQGGGADDIQSAMLRYWDQGYVPIANIHDELLFEFPMDTPDAKLLDFFSVMSAECEYMPDFRCPVKVQRGPNWLDMTPIGTV